MPLAGGISQGGRGEFIFVRLRQQPMPAAAEAALWWHVVNSATIEYWVSFNEEVARGSRLRLRFAVEKIISSNSCVISYSESLTCQVIFTPRALRSS